MTTPTLLVLAVVVLTPLVWYVASYNRFVSQRTLIESSWAGVDVELTRRHDLVPNLVATVQGYAAHERDVLETLTRAREAAVPLEGTGPQQRTAVEDAVGVAIGTVLARVEAYPELRASENFLQLQRELATTEDRIAASRRFFNNNVAAYNTRVRSVPSNLVAALSKFELHAQFQLRDASVSAVPSIDLDTPPA